MEQLLTELLIYGKWDNQAGIPAFEYGNSTVNFIGGTQQSINNSQTTYTTSSFYDVEINNASGAVIGSNNYLTIDNELTLTNGVFTTGSSKYLVINNSNASSINAYSGNSFIYGNLIRKIAVNTSTYPFPVGDGTAATNYKLLDYINNNINLSSSDDYLLVNVASITESGNNVDANLNTYEDGTLINELMESAVWTVSPLASYSSGSWGTRLYVKNVSGLSAADDNHFSALKRNNTSTYADWNTFDSSTDIPNQGSAGRIYNAGNGYAQKTGFTSFSQLAIGRGIFTLPVELLSFDAEYNGATVDINWYTASEINNDYFDLERSSDGIDFNSIARLYGAGHSSLIQEYYYEDTQPVYGVSYYRLKQVDYDGQTSYSDPVAIQITDEDLSKFWFDTDNSNINIILSKDETDAVLQITDLQGKVVYIEKLCAGQQQYIINVNANSVDKGIYIMSLKTSKAVQSKRVFIN